MRKVWSKIQTTVMRGIVTRSSDTQKCIMVQVEWAADRTSSNVEYKQPQGLYFNPADKAEGQILAVAGDHSSAVLIDAQSRSDSPGGGGIEAGEGGLYYAGDFKVFLDKDGLVHLGEKTGSDFVALAAAVKSELDKIKTDLDNVKSTFDGHTHIITVVSVDGDTATAAPPASPVTTPHTPGSVAATKVKAT